MEALRALSLRSWGWIGDSLRMDDVDVAILNELQKDSRLSLAELGRRVGLTAAPVQRRLRSLERDGWVTAYVAIVSPARAGLQFEAFVEVELEAETPRLLAAFEDGVAGVSEVTECHRITGAAHYLLRVVARDARAFDDFYLSVLLTLPGVTRTTRRVSLSRVKYSTALPLSHLPRHT